MSLEITSDGFFVNTIGFPSLKIEATEIKFYYGLLLALNDETFKFLENIDAEHKADILITYNNIKKEFSLQEFVMLLGFTE